MAMFELEDSKGVKIRNSDTTGETLVSGKGLPDLDVENCRAGVFVEPALPPIPSRFSKAIKFSAAQIWAVLLAIVVAFVLSYLGLS